MVPGFFSDMHSQVAKSNNSTGVASIFQAEALVILYVWGTDDTRCLGHDRNLKRKIIILIDNQAAIKALYSMAYNSGWWDSAGMR